MRKLIISKERRMTERVQNESNRATMHVCFACISACAYVCKYVREKNKLENQQKQARLVGRS